MSGGMMQINGSNLRFSVLNSKLKENTASNGDGGCIFGRSDVTMDIQNTNIVSNQAGKNGGCMSFGDDTNVNISSSILDKNIANQSGGIMYMKTRSYMYLVKNTTITNNKAIYRDGGGFYNLAIYNIVSTTIHNNSARDNGGFLYVDMMYETKLRMIQSSFKNNIAKTKSGGVMIIHNVLPDGLFVDIVDTQYVQNQAGMSGGMMQINGSNLRFSVLNSKLKENTASNGDGGCIFGRSDVTMDIQNTNIVSNQAGKNGGCMSFGDDTNVNISSSILDKNIANQSGGIMYMKTRSYMYLVKNTTITNNKAIYRDGGGFYNLAIYNIVSTTIHNNSARDNGGFLYVDMMYETKLRMIQSSFKNNIAKTKSGGVMIIHNVLPDGLFVDIVDTQYVQNQAGMSGGMMQINGSNLRFSVLNSKLKENTASNGDGGCIFGRSDVTMDIQNTNIVSNQAGKNGGCMSFGDDTNVNISSSILDKNIANQSGGIMYMKTRSYMYLVKNTTITNNKAIYRDGGGFYNLAIYNIVSTTIHNNSARDNGGFLYVDMMYETKLRMIQSSFKNNIAKTKSGGVMIIHNVMPDGLFVDIVDTQYVQNQAGMSGGMMQINGSNLRFSVLNSKLKENTASNGDGGCIFGRSDVTMDIQNTNIVSNQAGKNGGCMSFGDDTNVIYIIIHTR